jgi:ComEC/Rec2-related protein
LNQKGGPSDRLTPGPLVLVAICLCGGTLAGFRSLGVGASAWISLTFALDGARNSSRLKGRTTAGLLLAATFAAGAASGQVADLEAGRSCLTRLENGQALKAGGRLASPLAAEPAPAKASRSSAIYVRVIIVGAEFRTEAGDCSVPRLLALVRRPQHALPAGTIVRLRGKWSAYRRPGAWPRRPERRGYVRAKISAAAPAGPSIEPAEGALAWPATPASGLGPLQRVRAAGIHRVESRLPADVSPTAVAILLAERGRLDPATSRTFANAGLAHLLAISGLHVGILAAAALAATGIFAVGAIRHLVAALLVLGYVLVIGAPPAAVRAALIFCGYAASRARGSPARITDMLALAATLAVLADPLTLLEPGFQLSFAGFSGLLLGSRVVRRLDRVSEASPSVARRRTRRIVRSLSRGIGASAGAFALTAPIAAWHFQRTAPVSVVSSLIGSPVVALALLALAGVLLLPGPLAPGARRGILGSSSRSHARRQAGPGRVAYRRQWCDRRPSLCGRPQRLAGSPLRRPGGLPGCGGAGVPGVARRRTDVALHAGRRAG